MGPACAVINFRRSFLFLSFLFVHQRVMSDLTCKPMDSEFLVNETAYFNCSSSIAAKEIHWYHYPVGVEVYQRRSVYAFGKFYKDYEEDFVIEKNSSSGVYNIVIRSVKPSYAGRYECQDDGGHGNSYAAQLVVLDGKPECISNINPDGVIGSNTCGIQPDELHLSCSISYHGNIPPELKWVKLGENDSISGNVTKVQLANRFTYNLTVKADLLKDKSSFECQTTISKTSKQSCTSETVKQLYIFSASSVSIKSIGEVVNCSADTSSRYCQYKWKWYNKEDSLTVSDNRILQIEKEGQHRCEATCVLRNKQCTVNAILINANSTASGLVTIDSSGSSAAAVWVPIVILICVLVVVILVTLFIVLRWKHGHKGTFFGLFQTLGAEEKRVEAATPLNEVPMKDASPLLKDDRIPDIFLVEPHQEKETKEPEKRKKTEEPKNEETDYVLRPELLHVESLKSANNEKTVIIGLTVLDKELFVAFEKESEVQVFQAIAFSHVRSFVVMDLDNPLDMVASPMDLSLYISSPNNVYRVDTSGKVIVKWPIEDGGGTLSATHDQTVILSDWKRTVLREYSADGQLICEVKLPSDHPFHAVKISIDQFVVSYEHRMVHKVAKFDMNGTIIQSFSGMLKFPKYLAVNSDGYIFVAEQKNSRVLMMNPTLESSAVILSDKDKLGRPLRICLDEENNRMFVADIKADNLMVFRLRKHKTAKGANEDIAVNQTEPLGSNQNLKEDLGATKDTDVNQDEPLDSNHDHKEEDSGGMEDKAVVISDNEEEEEEYLDAEDTLTLEQSRGEKRKR